MAAVLDAHLAVEAAGFVASDFYDGAILYDFAGGRLRLCGLDEGRAWRGTAAQLAVLTRATAAAPEERWPTVREFVTAWQRAG